MRFPRSVQPSLVVPPGPTTFQGRLQPFLYKLPSYAFDRCPADLKTLGDSRVTPTRAILPAVGLQQDPGMYQLPGRCLPNPDQLPKSITLLIRERHDIPLDHRWPPCHAPAECIEKKPADHPSNNACRSTSDGRLSLSY